MKPSVRSSPSLLGLFLAARLTSASMARGAEPPARQVTATVASGTLLPEDHVYRIGARYDVPSTLYLGLSVDAALSRRVHFEGSFGVELALGWVVGTTLRFVPIERGGFSLSLGVGPLIAFGAPFGSAVFGEGDLGVRYRLPQTPFVVLLNAGLAYALDDAGTMGCGVDTCSSYIRRGDRLETVVASLGYAFDL
jgi:hypothetical protein